MLRVLCCLLLVLPALASADVYVYTDPDAVEHYTNVPDQDRYRRLSALMETASHGNRAGAPIVKGNAARYAAQVERAADEAGVDPALVHAVVTAESGYNPRAVSPAGAQGLMQLMPATARRYAVSNAFDPAENVRGGTRYLRDLLDMFDNDVALALAAYNAGENAVLKYHRTVPPYRETRAYVPKVLRLYDQYAALAR